MRWKSVPVMLGGLMAYAVCVSCQPLPSRDVILRNILYEGTTNSQLYSLAQPLLDSIGPRLTGSVEQKRAIDWVTAVYRRWGVPVHHEQYGTWKAWRRGSFQLELVAPRLQTLQGMLMTWSAGTSGPVEGPVVIYPAYTTAAAFEKWLATIRGKFVLVSFPEPTCRPDENWRTNATPESFERMKRERAAARDEFYASRRNGGPRGVERTRRLEAAGALGIVVSLVSVPQFIDAWGTSKIGTAQAEVMSEVGLGCEEYSLLFRLAQNHQAPAIRLNAKAQFGSNVPAVNVIAELRGNEKPNEYVVLSAHLDSWDAATGSTDNGGGTVTMMEAMRILHTAYRNPKRTILVGHWSGEEQGLNGSRAFAVDHAEILNGLQVLLNQDSGTGRIDTVSMQGIAGAADFFRRWLQTIPAEIGIRLTLIDPGSAGGGSDQISFVCEGAPAFSLQSIHWDYERYTWHTNRDTFDKLVFDDLRTNATLVAMLAYLAAEEPQRLPWNPQAASASGSIPASKKIACPTVARSWEQRRQ